MRSCPSGDRQAHLSSIPQNRQMAFSSSVPKYVARNTSARTRKKRARSHRHNFWLPFHLYRLFLLCHPFRLLLKYPSLQGLFPWHPFLCPLFLELGKLELDLFFQFTPIQIVPYPSFPCQWDFLLACSYQTQPLRQVALYIHG